MRVETHSVCQHTLAPINGVVYTGAKHGLSFAFDGASRLMTVHRLGLWMLFIVVAAVTNGPAGSVAAQEPEAATREAALEQERIEKLKILHPYVPGKTEALFNRAEDILINGVPRWHPFFESAYYGGGFTLGAGYAHHVSPYNLLDVRGSYTVLGYKRIEAELTAPRLFHRRGSLSLVGGWREAAQ